ncbi:MAG: hypothetical protein IIZ10_09435 [Solobacterium sp.]|jgi:hypothetical protein|nr:hypothetical protein [Solobacterium sp.]
MKRLERIDKNCITYTYTETNLSKEEMLGYIVDILADDDIVANGVIIVAPQGKNDWPGDVIEIPGVPERETFVESFKDAAMSGITSILSYHGQQMMLTYRPAVGTLSVILPAEFRDTIDDVEKNVIPDAIDENPA